MPDRDQRPFLDWMEVGAPQGAGGPAGHRQLAPRTGQLAYLIAAVVVLVAVATPLAIAGSHDGGETASASAVGDPIREGVRNGTTTRETEIIGRFDATTTGKGGYVTRQSNTQTGPKAGGGAIYGCRGAAGGTAAGSAPCLRASNLANGFAFEFNSTAGPAGLITVGAPADPPFVTNGQGLVANLFAEKAQTATNATNAVNATNATKAADADKLGGKDPSEYEDPRVYARVEEDGTAVAALSKGIESSNITNPSTGIYCFDLPFNPVSVQVTVEGNSDPDEIAQAIDADSPDGLVNCPAGTEIEVSHYDVGTPGFENGDFYIWIE